MPLWLYDAGAIILLCYFYLFFLTFRENSYLSPVVRIQSGRGHTEVSSWHHGYVRYPMYSAFILFAIGIPLLIGSWYSFVPGLIVVGLAALRAVKEKCMFRKELKCYEVYMARV